MTNQVPEPEKPAVSNWNSANIITVSRIVMVPVFIVLYLQDAPGYQWAAAIIFGIAASTDKLDGYLARSRGLVTDLGKLLDPFADKALVLSAMIILSIDGALSWWITIPILVREIGITLLRQLLVRRGTVLPASRGGKLKTTLQIFFLQGMLIPWITFLSAEVVDVLDWIWLIGALLALVVTVVTGLEYVYKSAGNLAKDTNDESGEESE